MCICIRKYSFMGFFDFLKNKSRLKPSDVLRKLSVELKGLRGEVGKQSCLSISDEECNELENYLAAACSGTTANVYVKKQPKNEEVDKCLTMAGSTEIMLHIAQKIAFLTAETRRIVSAIWGYLLKMEHPKSFQRPMVEYLLKNPEAVNALFGSYGRNTNGIDVIIGVMIRDATRFQKVIEHVFKRKLVLALFPVLTSANFDVSSDAFQTLKEILVNHKDVSAPWLSQNFDIFFDEYMRLVENASADEYVTVRQSLGILSSILLDRQFMDVMIQFVNKEEFLKPILILMNNKSKVVQFEAFHIFKIFAANPNKTPNIMRILIQNHDRIMKILDHIEKDRSEDVEFTQDKAAVVRKLISLKEKIERGSGAASSRKASSHSSELGDPK